MVKCMKNATLVRFRKALWKSKLKNLEANICYKYGLKPAKCKALLDELDVALAISLDFSLEKFVEQFELMRQTYKKVLKLYAKK